MAHSTYTNQILLLLAAALIASGWPSFTLAARDFHPHSGYLESTKGEREARYSDMVVLQPPQQEGPTLRDRIFNDKLSREFRERYEEKFGKTEVERVYNSPTNRFAYFNDLYGFRGSVEEDYQARRNFADYMVKRLAEWHVDNYTKTEPKMRAVYETKQKLSNMKIEVAEYRLDIQYDLAGNNLDLKLMNPYFPLCRFRQEFNDNETSFSIGRNLTSKIFVEGHYKMTEGIAKFIGSRGITERMGSTLTVSTFTNESKKSRRESLYLAGLSYVF